MDGLDLIGGQAEVGERLQSSQVVRVDFDQFVVGQVKFPELEEAGREAQTAELV